MKKKSNKIRTNKNYTIIFNEISKMIKSEELVRKSDIFRRVKGDDHIKRKVIDNLVKERLIIEELRKNNKVGRPKIYLRLK